MPGWGRVLKEFNESARARGQLGPDSDGIRLKYIRRLNELSGRAVIVYSSGFLVRGGSADPSLAVDASDVHALMEVCHDVTETSLDLIIHSPGGSPEAAEQMLNYLRTQFKEIRAFVPLQAKSAATMLALGCDEIWMGEHSELGPIDPQILVPVPEGRRYAPAHAILRDFQRAKDDLRADVSLLPAWTPILRSYAGGLIEFCQQQVRLSLEVVQAWLEKYMLADVADETERIQQAEEIARFFGSEEAYDRFRTHGRPLRVEQLEQLPGIKVQRLESDDSLQDTILSIYHATDLTFGRAALVSKIVENHVGARYVKGRQELIIQAPAPLTPGTPSPAPARPPLPVHRDPPKPRSPHKKKRK